MPRRPRRMRWAVIHGAAIGHARVFGVLNYRKIDFGRRRSVSRALSLRMGLPSSLAPTAPARKAPIGQHRSLAGRVAAAGNTFTTAPRSGLLQPGDPLRRVHHGLRVGHAADGVNPPRLPRHCRWRWFPCSFVRVPQVNMQIDEARSDDQPRASNFSCAVPRVCPAARSRPPCTSSRTSMGASILAAGSMSRPPLINRLRLSRVVKCPTFLPLYRIYADQNPMTLKETIRENPRESVARS